MLGYILRRLLLIIPTLFGIMVLNFIIVQAAPGGPVERTLAELQGRGVDAAARVAGTATGEVGGGDLGGGSMAGGEESGYRGARGLDPELVREIERLYGFDRPAGERFVTMMLSYLRLDFGESLFRGRSVSS